MRERAQTLSYIKTTLYKLEVAQQFIILLGINERVENGLIHVLELYECLIFTLLSMNNSYSSAEKKIREYLEDEN